MNRRTLLMALLCAPVAAASSGPALAAMPTVPLAVLAPNQAEPAFLLGRSLHRMRRRMGVRRRYPSRRSYRSRRYRRR